MAYGIVTAGYVLARLETMPIVDVRPASYYEESRIPHALSVPMLAVKELGGDVAAEMARRVRELGIRETDDAIVYCMNGGLAREACGLLESQGYAHLHCYEGSWADWVSDPTRPVERSFV